MAENGGISKKPRLGSGPGQEANITHPSGQERLNAGDNPAPGRPAEPQNDVRRYSRTFIHYVEIGDDGGDDTFTSDAYEEGDEAVELTFEWAWKNIEYWRLNASMTKADIQAAFIGTKRWRMKEMGFEISNIIPTTEELGTVGGAVTETLTFNQRPYMFTYIDDKYALFQNSQNSKQGADIGPNRNFVTNLPTTRAEGNLNRVKDYRTVSTPWWERNRPDNTIPAEDTQSGDAEEFMSAFNTDGWSALHTGETWGFTWVQSSKLWFPAMEYSMMRTVKIGNEDPLNIQSMVGEVGPWNQGQSTNEWIPTNTGEWPASVEGAMKNPFTGDFTQTSKMVTTMLPFHSNSPPPIACIRSPKLLKSNDSPMKLTFQITCTYHCVIELERYDGGPQNAGFMPNVRYTEFKNAGSNREVGIQGAYPSKMTSLNSWPYNQRVYQGTHSEFPRPLTK